MRLWHQLLISRLPRQQLLGLHRELCALRGKGWGKKHATVDYAFKYQPDYLVAYHYLVMDEMERRGYHPDRAWRNICWRGDKLGEQIGWVTAETVRAIYESATQFFGTIFKEHNESYLVECLDNLKAKGIEIEVGSSCA